MLELGYVTVADLQDNRGLCRRPYNVRYYEGQRERGDASGGDQRNVDDVGCGDLRHDSNTLMNNTSFLTNKIKPLSQ